jgi:hypothetical protein
MATVTFDTLKFANRLKEAGVPDKQAEAEARALSEVLEVNFDQLAIKRDLYDLEARLKARLDTMEARMTGEQTLLKWMMGPLLGGVAALILKAFF